MSDRILLESGDVALLESEDAWLLESATPTVPVRRRFRQETGRDTLASRPSGARGRETTWWD